MRFPASCMVAGGKKIVCKEKGRTMIFENPQLDGVLKIAIDGCADLRRKLPEPNCALCDYLVIHADQDEHFVELKGRDVEHALEQLQSALDLLATPSRKRMIYCWVVSSETPAASSKFQNLRMKFEARNRKRFPLQKLHIQTRQATHWLNT